jgi:hypothetical protein
MMKMPLAEHMIRQRHRLVYAEDILTLNAAARATCDEADGAGGCAGNGAAALGERSAHLLPIALQPGPRVPAVSNLQTDSAAIFQAVRCGFARAYDALAPEERRDGWDAARPSPTASSTRCERRRRRARPG